MLSSNVISRNWESLFYDFSSRFELGGLYTQFNFALSLRRCQVITINHSTKYVSYGIMLLKQCIFLWCFTLFRDNCARECKMVPLRPINSTIQSTSAIEPGLQTFLMTETASLSILNWPTLYECLSKPEIIISKWQTSMKKTWNWGLKGNIPSR